MTSAWPNITYAYWFVGRAFGFEPVYTYVLPRIVTSPKVCGSTYVYTGSNPNARPTNEYRYAMYGQADVTFVPTAAP